MSRTAGVASGRLAGMRIARFTHNDVPQYAFVQTDKNDGKDYLVALNGYPLSGRPSSRPASAIRWMVTAFVCWLR